MSSMFCTKIYQCKNADWCARDFNPKTNGAPSCFEPMTNADKIRQMSDEELVDAWYYIYHHVIFNSTDSRQGLLDWLKQEVESDEN